MSLLVTALHGAGALSPQVPKQSVLLSGPYQRSRSCQWNCMAGFSLTFSSQLGLYWWGTHFKSTSLIIVLRWPCSLFYMSLRKGGFLRAPEYGFWKSENFCLWLIGLFKAQSLVSVFIAYHLLVLVWKIIYLALNLPMNLEWVCSIMCWVHALRESE